MADEFESFAVLGAEPCEARWDREPTGDEVVDAAAAPWACTRPVGHSGPHAAHMRLDLPPVAVQE